MEVVKYNKADYIETQSGNKVSKRSVLCGSQNIVLLGKTIVQEGCVIRGDLANIRVGRQCVFKTRAVLRPPWKILPNRTPSLSFLPMMVGDGTIIEENALVAAASIGSYVHIGKDAIIGSCCILKDCCKVEAGAVLPPNTVVPPFAIFGGSPAKLIGQLPECARDLHRDFARQSYSRFQPEA
eukprot:TRINITY_DN11448_c1_g1_i3.p2 TRINITY_DN11448_c1_g1~~TRINITY_DN11448_c1_g1_i3.p2  ORF type:complete len:182 (+),score=24.48 TRINITY_DN11448_c1_g1_i3:125-670(+)